MKKLIVLLFAVMAMITVSCTSDQDNQYTTGLQKTSVAFIVTSPKSDNTTSKQVQRGDIPVWVNRIDVVATLNGGSVYSTPGQFDLVPNSATSTIEKIFTIENVAIGNNTFTATTTTDSAQKYVLAPSSGTAGDKIIELKSHNPYVLYTGNKTQNIALSANVINLDMTTQYGRILSVFKLEDNAIFKSGYEATITAKVDGVSAGSTKVQQSGIVYFEWSNDISLDGKKVIYTVDVTPINNNNDLHTIYTIEQVIKASTSISCIYTINKDKAPSPYTNENKLVFSFQKWNEETCSDCK